MRVLALALVLSCSLASTAQSFDCSHASTPREKAVCSNPNLGKLDAELGAQFKRVHEGVPLAAAPDVLANQRAWLRSLDTQCPSQRNKAPDSDCLVTEYGARLDALSSERPLPGGHWLITEGAGAASHPAILTPNPAEAVWNRAVLAQITSRSRASAKELAKCKHEATGTGADTAENMESLPSWRLTAVNDHFITTRFAEYAYCGGAHGTDTFAYWTWSLDQGRGLTATDIFRNGTSWKQRAADAAVAQLRKETASDGWDYLWKGDELTKGVNAALGSAKQWTPARDGLHIQFFQYQVAAYVFDEPSVVIPWNDLTASLAPAWKPETLPEFLPDPDGGN